MDKFETARNQALLFRLSGWVDMGYIYYVAWNLIHHPSDFNPLHADVNLAPLVGYERPILHGLCSYGKAVHSILRAFGNNDRLRFKSITARFAQPVLPGETVEIHMWKVEGPEPKTDGVIFIAKVGDRVVLSNGYVVLHKEAPESKL